MVGAASWVTLVGVMVTSLALLALWWAARRPSGLDTYTGRLTCPVQRHAVEVVAVRDRKTGAWVRVTRCTGCIPPDCIDCGQRCLESSVGSAFGLLRLVLPS